MKRFVAAVTLLFISSFAKADGCYFNCGFPTFDFIFIGGSLSSAGSPPSDADDLHALVDQGVWFEVAASWDTGLLDVAHYDDADVSEISWASCQLKAGSNPYVIHIVSPSTNREFCIELFKNPPFSTTPQTKENVVITVGGERVVLLPDGQYVEVLEGAAERAKRGASFECNAISGATYGQAQALIQSINAIYIVRDLSVPSSNSAINGLLSGADPVFRHNTLYGQAWAHARRQDGTLSYLNPAQIADAMGQALRNGELAVGLPDTETCVQVPGMDVWVPANPDPHDRPNGGRR